MKFLSAITLFWLSVVASSCANNEVEEQVETAAAEAVPAVAAANPAAVHCLDAGFELAEAKLGETTQLMCVDVEHGKKCPVWKYYRQECELSS